MAQVGVGGYGRKWLEDFTPPNIADETVELVGIADFDADALAAAQAFTRLPAERCFSSAEDLYANIEADFVLISTPQRVHEEHIYGALDAGLCVLCEKPISDSLEATLRIHERMVRDKAKIAVTITHRFDQRNTTFRQALKSGKDRPLDYLVFRLTANLRRYGAWLPFRHEMDDVMLNEAAIHHFDILRDLADAKCETIFARSWTSPWGEFKGGANVMALLKFENGVEASYESTACNAMPINPYLQHYLRAECENGTLIMNNRRIERHRFDPSGASAFSLEGEGEPIDMVEQSKFGNSWLIERFARWLDGGAPMETDLADHVQSQMMVFAALESVHTGREIDVQDLFRRARAQMAT